MSVNEIVFISGKGGTGKTTLTSYFSTQFNNGVIADCDVDAPDLDILLKPEINSTEDFISTKKAIIEIDKCTNCGKCLDICRFKAIAKVDNMPSIKSEFCQGCETCTLVCNADAIRIEPYKTGEIFNSETKWGHMVHARLTPGEEVSGKLVSEVRKQAKNYAVNNNKDFVIIDGPPGVACNVISAITGTKLALVVTEPTVSGFHDLIRVLETATKLGVKSAVIINKYNISEYNTKEIRNFCKLNSIEIIGEIGLDKKIRTSINRREIPSLNGGKMVNKIKNIIYNP